MNRSILNITLTTYFVVFFTGILSGCEGKGQIPIHEKNAETQTSESGGATSGPAGSSTANRSSTPAN